MNVTFIGGGNMATAIAGALIARGANASGVRVVEPRNASGWPRAFAASACMRPRVLRRSRKPTWSCSP